MRGYEAVAAALKQGESLNIHFLHFHLIRIDLLIRTAVRRWQLAGQDFSEKFRGLFISQKDVQALLNRPLGGNWGTGIELPEDENRAVLDLQQQVEDEIADLRASAQGDGIDLRLDLLIDLFDLSPFEFDVFMICLAPMLDPRYERIYGYLQDDVTRRFAGINLIFDLLLPVGLEKIRSYDVFGEEAPLRKYELIKSLQEQGVSGKPLNLQHFFVPLEIVSWLRGKYRPAGMFAAAFHFSEDADRPTADASLVDLPADSAAMLSQRPFIALYGQDELQQRLTAEALAGAAECPLLYLDLRKLPSSTLVNQHLVDLLLRDARLTGAVPVVTGWEENPETRGDLDMLFQMLIEHQDTVMFFCSTTWPVARDGKPNQKPVVWLDCGHPSAARRLDLWQRYLGQNSGLSQRDLEILASQFTLTASQIQNAAFAAKDLAFQKGISLSIDALYQASRSYSSHHLGSLAVKIIPRYSWEDIVLPEDEMESLHEIANTIRLRSVVLEGWGVGERLMPYSGVSALFAGPPGTGKTLAAQVIAAELKMDLYKIDLSTVVSKYIGETEKNLERIFSQAKNSNAILFFDEADSIFGKRSEVKDAHDRYANIEVGYLLQRMESYDGVVILATNLRSNLDDAFTRRIQFIIDFPFPDEAERTRIWQVLFPPGVPRGEDVDFDEFGQRFRLSGGSIRNVIVAASFLAASDEEAVGSQHLIHAIRREMQKMGRLVNENDLSVTTKVRQNGKDKA